MRDKELVVLRLKSVVQREEGRPADVPVAKVGLANEGVSVGDNEAEGIN